MKEFDVVILGGGTAGVAAAQSAIEQGARVGLVESDRLGGHSLLKGQLPLQLTHDHISKSGKGISFKELVQEVDKQGENASKEIEKHLSNIGVEYIEGKASLTAERQVTVHRGNDSSLLKATKIIIATGSLPKPVAKIPFDDESIFHIDKLLDWKEAPTSLMIVGGDKTGLEAAYLFSLLGSKVFLVEEKHRLIHDRDPDLITALEAEFKQRKIKVLLGKKIISIFKDDEKIDVTLDGGVKFSTEKVLVSGERSGNTSQLGLDSLDIEKGAKHEIWVNEHMETSIKGIFAAGSVTGRQRSLQISKEEGRIAGVNAAGKRESIDRDQIPFFLLTQPEVASIGCLSGDAHYKGYRAVQGRYDFSRDAASENQSGGFCKIIADRESKQLIGAQMLGAYASEAIVELQSKIREGVTVKMLTETSESPPQLRPVILAAQKCVQALSARR